jgi:transposase-like protein
MNEIVFTKDGYVKYHENYEFMHQKYVVEKKSIKDIANTLHISKKLVTAWLKTFGLYVPPKEY